MLASGVELALLDADGTAVHRRTFVSDAAAIAYEVRVAADPDGTRAFIFLRNNAHHYLRDVPVGTYRFALTFRRTGAGRAGESSAAMPRRQTRSRHSPRACRERSD